MKETLLEVKISVLAEYERATKKFGLANNSAHESYAVIKEEYEEAIEQGETFAAQLEYFWEEVKTNNAHKLQRLTTMCDFAEHAAAEWIQVAAMCYKATKKKE